MSGDHNMAQEPTGIERLAHEATVRYAHAERSYEKVLDALHEPKDDEHPLGREGEVLMLIANAFRAGWKEGFTARLSGTQEDE
jgi:hypothetical protein